MPAPDTYKDNTTVCTGQVPEDQAEERPLVTWNKERGRVNKVYREMPYYPPRETIGRADMDYDLFP